MRGESAQGPRPTIYLDWNATAPLFGAAFEAMAKAARDAWANPSSAHGPGRTARSLVEDARAAVAELAEADPRDVVFTSGGTEANNLALRSAFRGPAGAGQPGVLATSRLEHASIARVAEALEAEGKAIVRWVRVCPGGILDLEHLERILGEGGVKMVALQAVNHETGVIQPVGEALTLARRAGALVHVDAIQAFGRVEATWPAADSRSLAGHKIRGPKGIGALVTQPGLRLDPVLFGGGQERGLRPGTLDPVAAAGLAVACRHASTGPSRYRDLAKLRDALEGALLALDPGAKVAGSAPRAPHVSTIVWPGWIGAELVAALDLEGVAVSSGSACSAGTTEASPVLRAMLGDVAASAGVRVSIGEETTRAEIDAAVRAFARVIARTSANLQGSDQQRG